MTPWRGAWILSLSLGAIASGLGADVFSSSSTPGLGPLQRMLCAAGLAGVVLVALPGALRVHYARGLLALGTAYLCAFACELVLMPPVVREGRLQTSEQGLVRPSSWGGYELTPGWRGAYDDGVDRVAIEINALGDRDDAPSPRDAERAERILLLGDSFTFGVGLAKSQTIEAQIERESAGRAVAYSLGVGGYGPGDTLEHYRERTAFPATHTFFLLYGNDLRDDNCTAAFHTAVDGAIVPRAQPDGTPYTTADVERALDDARREDARLWIARLKSALALSQLRARALGRFERDVWLGSGAPERFSRACALAAAERAAEMSEIARARGQRFAVVVLPTATEAQRGRTFELMQLCIDELRRRSIAVIEVRGSLAFSDYFRQHEHLNASGAGKVAQAILAAVEESALPPVAR